MSEKPIISIKDLTFSWNKKSRPILNIPHWSVNKGQRVFLYGRSGSGKSTLLNLISGILQSSKGSLEIDGNNIGELPQSKRDHFRAKNIGVIFQQFNLIPYLTIEENILLSQKFSGVNYGRQRLMDLTNKLGLAQNTLQQKTNELSIGQQQRVAVIRALFHKPKLIIADEPTSALDSENRDEFIELLLEQSQTDQSTVLFVSHDKSLARHFDMEVNIETLNQINR